MPMTELDIPPGTLVFWGRPAHPMAGYLSRCIAAVVASVPGIAEAHLPQCLVSAATARPAQVLILVLRAGAESRDVLTAVERGLDTVFRPDQYLDVMTIATDSSLLATVKGTGCRIFSAESRGI
jgi:hypothetical protein